MKEESLKSLRRRLTKVCLRELRAVSRNFTAPFQLLDAHRRVIRSNTGLLDQLSKPLREAEVWNILRALSKKAHRAGNQQQVAEQLELAEMEQFRGVPLQVSYIDGRKVKWTAWFIALKSERRAAIAHRRIKCAQSDAVLDAMESSDAWLDPLTERFGDLPPYELVRMWKEAGGQTVAAGA
jgi:hypothetical protein